jgi:hypothetical protein
MQRRREQFEMLERPQGFGVRRQSAAAMPLLGRQQAWESGVALRFPPQSKTLSRLPKRNAKLRVSVPLRLCGNNELTNG